MPKLIFGSLLPAHMVPHVHGRVVEKKAQGAQGNIEVAVVEMADGGADDGQGEQNSGHQNQKRKAQGR